MEDPQETVSSGPHRTDAHMNAQGIHGLKPGGGPVLRGGSGLARPFLTQKISPADFLPRKNEWFLWSFPKYTKPR